MYFLPPNYEREKLKENLRLIYYFITQNPFTYISVDKCSCLLLQIPIKFNANILLPKIHLHILLQLNAIHYFTRVRVFNPLY